LVAAREWASQLHVQAIILSAHPRPSDQPHHAPAVCPVPHDLIQEPCLLRDNVQQVQELAQVVAHQELRVASVLPAVGVPVVLQVRAQVVRPVVAQVVRPVVAQVVHPVVAQVVHPVVHPVVLPVAAVALATARADEEMPQVLSAAPVVDLRVAANQNVPSVKSLTTWRHHRWVASASHVATVK